MDKKTKPKNIDEFIACFPKDVQAILKTLRTTIRKSAPKAEETISYGIPTFTLHGNLVHFSAYKNHIGFYPAASGISAFKKELSAYKGAKGSVQFPIDKPLPLGLVSKIVKFRVKENLERVKSINLNTCSRGHTFQKSSNFPVCPKCWPGKYKNSIKPKKTKIPK